MQNQIVILAAGKGTRMGRKDIPKVLVPLRGKALISRLLEELKRFKQPTRLLIVIGFKNGHIKKLLGKDYDYALQRDQLGTAHAVWAAREKIKAKNILVLYGDMPFIKAKSLEKLMKLHESKQGIISMFTARVPNFQGRYDVFNHYGRIIRDTFGNITKITEYYGALPEVLEIKEVNPGIYMFNTEWLWENIDKIQNDNAKHEFYLTDIVEVAMRQGLVINSLPIDAREVVGINTQDQLKRLEGGV